jgi:hypothetical protein
VYAVIFTGSEKIPSLVIEGKRRVGLLWWTVFSEEFRWLERHLAA